MADLRSALLIDNDPAHAEVFREALLIAKDGPFHSEWAKTLSQGVERLCQKGIWAIFATSTIKHSKLVRTILSGVRRPGPPREAVLRFL
jgi:hypothetical protein